MCKAHDEVVHIRLEILEDSGLVCRREVWLKVSVSERMAVSGVLVNGFKVEHQPVPGGEFPTRGRSDDFFAKQCRGLSRPLEVGAQRLNAVRHADR
jgi:hypothetical protein